MLIACFTAFLFLCDISEAAAQPSLESILASLHAEEVKRKELGTYTVESVTKTTGFIPGKGDFSETTTMVERYENGECIEKTVNGKSEDTQKVKKEDSQNTAFSAKVDDFIWHQTSRNNNEIIITGKPKSSVKTHVNTYTCHVSADALIPLRSELEISEFTKGVSGTMLISIQYKQFRNVSMPNIVKLNGEGKALLLLSFRLNSS